MDQFVANLKPGTTFTVQDMKNAGIAYDINRLNKLSKRAGSGVEKLQRGRGGKCAIWRKL